jgi:hypothetical protein
MESSAVVWDEAVRKLESHPDKHVGREPAATGRSPLLSGQFALTGRNRHGR